MDPVTGPDLALTGLPRGGTTLACRLLHGHGDVALFEPMDVAALPVDRDAAIDHILHFFAEVRRQVLASGTAPSKQNAGTVPDNPFADVADSGGKRPLVAVSGTIRIEPRPAAGFRLAIKHNAAFAALLPELARRVPTIAIVRNPLAALASWNSIDLPVTHGRLPAGERFDRRLSARLRAEPDVVRRQVLLAEWFFSRFAEHPDPAAVLRYEDIVASRAAVLFERAGARRPPVALQDRNANRLYPRAEVPRLLEALLRHGSAWRRWYREADLQALAQALAAAG